MQRPRGLGGTVRVVCGQGLGSPLCSHQLLLPQPHAWPPSPPRTSGWTAAGLAARATPGFQLAQREARNRLEQKDLGSQDAAVASGDTAGPGGAELARRGLRCLSRSRRADSTSCPANPSLSASARSPRALGPLLPAAGGASSGLGWKPTQRREDPP